MIGLLLFALLWIGIVTILEIVLQRKHVQKHGRGSMVQLVAIHVLGLFLYVVCGLLVLPFYKDGFGSSILLVLLVSCIIVAYGASAIGGEDSPSSVIYLYLLSHQNCTEKQIVSDIKNNGLILSRVKQLEEGEFIVKRNGFVLTDKGKKMVNFFGFIRFLYGVDA
jgi:predicted transcriptional regulator